MSSVPAFWGLRGISTEALYRNLCEDLSEVSSYNGTDLLPGMSLADAAASRIRASLLKKFKVPGNRIADEAAQLKFEAVNSSCANWTLHTESLNSWDEELVGEFALAIDKFLHPKGQMLFDSFGTLLHKGALGPGASIASVGGDFYTKLFSSKLSVTSLQLYEMYSAYIRLFPEWSNAELIRTANFGAPKVVRGNRLSFVPKYTDISRTICTEPTLNMFFQLGLGNVLNSRLEDRYGIDLRRQQFKNRELARLGSIDDRFVTIDLESASDSISLRMLRRFLPGWFMATLEELRSPVTSIAGVERELHMVSTMGNGFTFALQTVLFACVVEAACRVNHVKMIYPRGVEHGNFGVNGDDIICPRESAASVVRLLTLLGFRVNHSKSYFVGPFRESCGGDYFKGRQIRGVYVKCLDSKQDLTVVVNQLNFWSAKTGIYLPRTVKYVASFLTDDVPKVPRWEDDSAGIKCPHSALKERWYCRDTGSLLYRPYVAVGRRLRITETRVLTPRGQRPRIYNPSGLLMALLHGTVNSSAIGFRHEPVRYKRKLRVAPYWDAMPEVSSIADEYSWKRWEIAYHANFNEA